jgi:hypothetical protein
VPNVFIFDLETYSTRRVTHLVTGATAHSWLPPDSTYPAGALLVTTAASKQRDEAYRIDASRTASGFTPGALDTYTTWTTHRPPVEIPDAPSLATTPELERRRYRSLRNLKHLASFGLPFYNQKDDWGLAGLTSWSEPLGKHLLGLTGSLSIPRPLENSFVLATYFNNQLRPTVGLSVFSLLPTATAYGNTYVVDGLSGGDLSIDWPLDLAVRPYTSTRFEIRGRYSTSRLLNPDDFAPLPPGLDAPLEGEQAEIRVTITRKSQRPYRHNVVHPLDGAGMRFRVTGAARILQSENRFLRGDLAVYRVVPGFFQDRFFFYGRGQWQTGQSFNQYRPGFARFDDLQITAPQFGILAFSNADRVRGYRQFVYGNRTLFGSFEYRFPMLPSLNTEFIGLFSLGATTFSFIADGGMVWQDGELLARRIGVGAEIKNALQIGGVLQLMHAVGIAQPATYLGTPDHYEVYYRVRAALPF